MIITTDYELLDLDDSNPITINIGRPTIFDDEDRDKWRQIHTWVKESETSIWVNGMFGFVEDVINEGGCYGGNGFAYNFWFETEEDKNKFDQLVKSVFAR